MDLSDPFISDLPRLAVEMNKNLRTVYPWPVESERNKFAKAKQMLLLGSGFVPHPFTPPYGAEALKQSTEVNKTINKNLNIN